MKRADRNEPTGFSDLWALWSPTKRDTDGRKKNKVQERYQACLDDGYAPDEVIQAARWHIEQLRAKGKLEYIELLASYLHGGAWLDDLDASRNHQRRLEESRTRSQENVVKMPERRVKTAYMLSWERQHGKDYFEHFDKQRRRAGE